MIVKGFDKHKHTATWVAPLTLVGLLVVLLVLKMGLPNATKEAKRYQSWYCNAEKVKGENFITNKVLFSGGHTQSSEMARSGKYAAKMTGDNLEGIGYTIKSPKAGNTYKAQIWFYSQHPIDCQLAVAAQDKALFFKKTDFSVETEGTWWQRFELYFTVPENEKITSLKVYIENLNPELILYADDFKLEEVPAIEGLTSSTFSPQELALQIDKQGLDKLKTVRERSFSQGLLIQEESDLIKAQISLEDGWKTAKVRYKGDWLDHIMTGTPSYRIALKSTDNWRGMQTFSVQHPKTRNYLHEWVYHKMLWAADVLSPRYDFIQFKINDKKPTVYAYEEHFNKNLIEHQLRREGPIVKFSEDRFWEGMRRSVNTSRTLADADNKEKAFWTAEIKPFKEKKTQNNPTLSAAFEAAQNLMYQYKMGLKAPNEVFDLDRMAKFLAISDLLKADHALTWHNQRFYYNPVTALLEPIGFDGYGTEAVDEKAPLYATNVYTQQPYSTEPIDRLFYDKNFITLYLKYLYQYANPSFLQQFYAQIDQELQEREQFIQQDWAAYKYDKEMMLRRSRKIYQELLPYANGLQVYSNQSQGDSIVLNIQNAHSLPLQITYVGKKKESAGKTFTSLLTFPQRLGDVPNYTTITAPNWATHIHYQLLGVDSTFLAPIPQWQSPTDWSPRQELLATLDSENPVPYLLEGDLILFKKDTYLIDQPLILPKDKKVVIAPGAVFQFKNGGFLLSFSKMDMRGDADEPIIVQGLDERSGSITIMQAKGNSELRHVIFKNQNTLDYKGWKLTGAVTFYESDVTIKSCQFIQNYCEDALNIVRGNFEVYQAGFNGIFSDAFDADFCKGKIQGSFFTNIGNDALDFSTSTIDIEDCQMKTIGDKAISAGEQATVSANIIKVDDAQTGFASKDLSVLTLDNITLKNSVRGFTAYQKKPEYGAATIILKKYEMEGVKYPFMIEKKSKLDIGN